MNEELYLVYYKGKVIGVTDAVGVQSFVYDRDKYEDDLNIVSTRKINLSDYKIKEKESIKDYIDIEIAKFKDNFK